MSRRSRTRSPASFDRRLSALETDDREEYPELTLATMFSAQTAGEFEEVAGEPDLVRCFGDIYRITPDFRASIRTAVEGGKE
jgi:hypothetical protein